MPELLGLPFSPWSEKARWALEARRVPYSFRLYAPLLGEPRLRLILRRSTGKVTVPVLVDDEGRAIGDSTDIARWADARGEGPVLFPPGEEAAMARFLALAERGLAAGRALSLARMLGDDEALLEMVPRPVRRALGPRAAALGAFGIRRTLKKYGASPEDREVAESTLVEVLDALRTALEDAPGPDGPKTLLGAFSFADIAMAQVLVSIEPPAYGLELGKATRRSFIHPGLRERYGDLVAWRDAVYATYRPKTAPR